MSAFLTRDDVVRLTGRKRFSAQRRALDAMKRPYIVARSGEPLVRPESLDAKARPAQRGHPRWHLINA